MFFVRRLLLVLLVAPALCVGAARAPTLAAKGDMVRSASINVATSAQLAVTSNLYTYAGASPSRHTDPTGEILPCLVANYPRCMVGCVATDFAMNAVFGCGDMDWAGAAKDCAVNCLWSMLPIPDPCGRFGKLFGAAVGLAAGLFNSFPAETPVHTRSLTDSGYQVQLKRIADIKIGDEVLALDELKAHDQQSHAQRYEKVTDIVSSEKQQRLVHLTLDNGQTLSATQGHPFKTEEGWRDAILLKKGGKLLLKDSAYATITDVSIEQKITPVFNLEVAQLHTFFVGEDGVVVHNGTGAYAIWFDDGSAYVGKGNESRMRDSIKERSKGRKVRKCKYFDSPKNDRDSFVLEDVLMERFEQPGRPPLLNERASPGKRHRGR